MTTPGYRPGLRGWWEYARLDGAPGFWRRARPSARLRQADRERADWKRWLYESELRREVQP